MGEKVLGFKEKDAKEIVRGIKECDSEKDATSWLKCHVIGVVSLEWLEDFVWHNFIEMIGDKGKVNVIDVGVLLSAAREKAKKGSGNE